MQLPRWTFVLGAILVGIGVIGVGFLMLDSEGSPASIPTAPYTDSRLTRLQVTPSPSPTLTPSPTTTPEPTQEPSPVVAEAVSPSEIYQTAPPPPTPPPTPLPTPTPSPTPIPAPPPSPTPPPTPILSEDTAMALINDYLRQNGAEYAWQISDCESSWSDYIWQFSCAREWVTNPCNLRGRYCPTTNTLKDGFLVFEDTRQVVQTSHFFLAI